ncbi:MAG: ABC transporter permease [Nitrospinae bacterium]|nr:ABC transporter permease [Nitrospinota bacterium]
MPFKLKRKNILPAIGLFIFLVLVFTAAFAPWIAPHDPFRQDLYSRLAEPGAGHIMGLDRLGRDILSRIIHGARISLMIGVIVVGISSAAGISIGLVAGYFGGRWDNLIMRICDVFLAFPGLLLAIALMAILGPGLQNVVLALSVMGWVGYARLVRGQVLSLKEREFVVAAKALGLGNCRTMFLHILPNISGPVLVEMAFGMAGAITSEAGLSFLGLGAQPPTPSWGGMLNEGRLYMLTAPHLTTFPGLAIMLTILGLNFLSDGLRDRLDPRSGVRRI